MQTEIFKAYDIRGRYPEEINEVAVREIAAALGKFFKKGSVVVGRDARLSARALEAAVGEGLGSAGRRADIIDAGLMTTPMLYFLVATLGAAGGIMVTASHNPKEFNGLKVVGPEAVPISGKEIQQLISNP